MCRSAAVYTIGASTLADIYEPAERGSKIGLFYAVPLIGPSLGVVLGGALTQCFNWRAIFWFLAIVAGFIFILFLLLLKDTFRRERSSTYQALLRKRQQLREQKPNPPIVVGASVVLPTLVSNTPSPTSVSLHEIKLSFMDVNPLTPLLLILRQLNNLAILFPSGDFPAVMLNQLATHSNPHHLISSASLCVQHQYHVHVRQDTIR